MAGTERGAEAEAVAQPVAWALVLEATDGPQVRRAQPQGPQGPGAPDAPAGGAGPPAWSRTDSRRVPQVSQGSWGARGAVTSALPGARWETATWAAPPDASPRRSRATMLAVWATGAARAVGAVVAAGVPETAQAVTLEPQLEVRTPRPPSVPHRSH
ncbi:MAG TPA: hypothetical protein VKD28_18740 [Gemmatimonadales bacterium]|nr:hypothetical protein [Gemmatimonadales bacterium]